MRRAVLHKKRGWAYVRAGGCGAGLCCEKLCGWGAFLCGVGAAEFFASQAGTTRIWRIVGGRVERSGRAAATCLFKNCQSNFARSAEVVYDAGMERQIKVKNKTYTIKLNAASVKAERVVFIENAFKGAIELAQACAEKLSGGGGDSEFAAVFGESGAVAKKRVCDVFRAVPETFEGVGVLLKKVFVDKSGRSPEVLASADAAANTISLYDAFFAEDPDPENDRPSVLLHEAAHLCGLKSDAESGSPDSAECVRNFALLVSGKIDIDTLLGKGQSDEADVEKDGSSTADGEDESEVADDDGDESEIDEDEQERGESERGGEEMPYRPDQLRAPKGQSNGGQWVSEGGGTGGAGSSDGASASQQSNKSQTKNASEKQPDTASTQPSEEKENKDEKPSDPEKAKEEEEEEKAMQELEQEMKDIENGISENKRELRKVFNKAQKLDEESKIKVKFKEREKGGEFKEGFSKNVSVKEGNENCNESDSQSAIECGLWVCNDMQISGLKPNTHYTVYIYPIYHYTDSSGNKREWEDFVAYSRKSDSNGNLIIDKIGWLNANNKKDNINIFEDIKIMFRVFLSLGDVIKNFIISHPRLGSRANYGPQRESRSLSRYLGVHASDENFEEENSQYNIGEKEEHGGVIEREVEPNEKFEIANGEVNVKHSGKVKRGEKEP